MRMLHTMLRTRDLQASLSFYRTALGMQVLRQEEYPDGRFTLAFIGYHPEGEATVLELTHNWDITHYVAGEAYGHIAIEVDCVASTCDVVRGLGYAVVRAAGPMKYDASQIIAFIEDPDGYKIELIQKRDIRY